jgi:outer membrane receptor protein involved in Fe transport
MARERKPQKDRTSFVIAIVLHVVLIGGVTFWAWKTGKLEQMRQAVLQYVRSDKKDQKQDSKPIQQKSAPQAKLPPINQGLPQTQSPGTRRAVASDAPSAAGGESFFQDTRKQMEGPSAGSSSMSRPTNATPMISKSSLPSPRPVFAAPPKATIKQLLAERSKAAASIESYGSEQISRSSVKDAGDIVSRVSGATVVEGKYAVIRGLTDRYSAATLNGAELPSADPYRRSAALNMFPAKIIDRVTVTKTFSPDQPGSFTGGNINIVTKSFPEKPFASLELGASYNSQSTGNKNFLTTSTGSTDWLGMDDGTRKLDKELWNHPLNIPSWRSQLGRPISLTSSSPSVQKNLADAAEIERLSELAGPADFAPKEKAPPPAQAFVAAFGDTAYFLGRPIGVFFSLPYSHSYGFYDNGTVTRVTYNRPGDPEPLATEKSFTEAKGVEEVNWAGTASLTYQLHPDHQFGYNFLFNQSSDNSARVRNGSDPDNSLLNMQLNRLAYVERNLTTHQFRSEDLFPALGGLKVTSLATFSETSQDLPDMRLYDTDSGKFGLSGLPTQYPSRYWQELEENNQNLKFDFVQPFHPRDALEAEFKFGFFKNSATRNYRERILRYDSQSYGPDPNDFLTEDRVGALNPPATNGNSVTYTWASYLKPPTDFSFYDGDNKVTAVYAMADFPLLENLRLIGGARLERTDIRLTAFTTTISEGIVQGTTNSSALKQDDLLPAIGLVWTVTSNMNLRLNYGMTVARPSFRELAPVRIFDFEYDAYVVGNPELKMSEIQNYDLRWEWFPRPGEIFSVGVFYKYITNPIELENISSVADILTFVNRPEGKVYGVEFEARKSLDLVSPYLREWNLGGNLSLIESEQPVPEKDRLTHTRPDLLESTRPLANQSPYIINLDLTYDNPRWGSTVSFNYNIFGPRLLSTSLNSPDVYEQPAAQFDVTFSQRIGRNLRLKLAARNLLDPVIKRTYGEDEEATYSSYTRGRTYSLSLTYEF